MKSIIGILLIFISIASSGQCLNTDFEYGDFTGWTGRRGSCCPINLPFPGIVPGRHTIMTPGIDPHSCGNLNTVYQGGFSARLGNDNVGSQAEGLQYTFIVDPLSTLIQYAYAVVFQDPGHDDGEQPIFNSRVRLMDGSIVECTEYSVSAGPNLPDYSYCDEFDILGNPIQVAYSDWRIIAIDLSAQVGQMVTMEFEVGDCDLGAHFGYAYIDAISCGPVESSLYYCQADDMILVEGPEGFATYEWNTGDTDRVITIETGEYDVLYCDVTTITGCELTIEIQLDPISLLAQIECEDVCLGEITSFINNTPDINGYSIEFLWNFGDGSTSTEFEPTHTYSFPGEYTVIITVSVVGELCADFKTCIVEIYELPQIINPISHD